MVGAEADLACRSVPLTLSWGLGPHCPSCYMMLQSHRNWLALCCKTTISK